VRLKWSATANVFFFIFVSIPIVQDTSKVSEDCLELSTGHFRDT
jgi:hypothetical protein